MTRNRTIIAALLFAGYLTMTTPADADDQLAQQIRDVIIAPRFKHAHWGILVADRATGEVIFEADADKLFPPASTTKLYSVAAALAELGADHCFETPVYRRGTVNAEGVLQGDLILVAVGDLTLGGRTTATNELEFPWIDHTYANTFEDAKLTSGDPLAGLNALAQQVANSRIRRVAGQVMIDARLFEPASSSGAGPMQVTPIIINDNLIDLSVTPTTYGSRAHVTWRPQSSTLTIDAKIQTISAGSPTKIDCRPAGDGRYIVRGSIAEDRSTFVGTQEVADPVRWARALFIEALQRAGVTIDASANEANPVKSLPPRSGYDRLDRVALFRSPPFSENVRLALKVSHNLHCSTMPLLIAARHGRRRLEDGMHLQREFLKRAGLDVDSISFAGGAGGASADYTSPRMNVALLRYMATRPDFAVYERGLPILGVDGTLVDHVTAASPARGKVRAKSGLLFWKNVMNDRFLVVSNALAGYLTAKSGRELVFSFVVNAAQIDKIAQHKEIGKVLGHLCELVVEAN
jgi:D-alanyl-D-alanine carboxypeptidase/D-alanyl-D-alanine-endopeptidase (penicillin-binding protein 4)